MSKAKGWTPRRRCKCPRCSGLAMTPALRRAIMNGSVSASVQAYRAGAAQKIALLNLKNNRAHQSNRYSTNCSALLALLGAMRRKGNERRRPRWKGAARDFWR
jgi:hypothetical protein